MSETIYCNKTTTEHSSGAEQFGFRDQKGREVGYRWSIRTVERTIAADGRWIYYAHQPMNAFEVWGTPTRDGKGYGPAFNTFETATLEEAQANVANRIKSARKRDAKKFVKATA